MLKEPGRALPDSVWPVMTMVAGGLLVWALVFIDSDPVSSNVIEFTSSNELTAGQASANPNAQTEQPGSLLAGDLPSGRVPLAHQELATPLLPLRIRLELIRPAHLNLVLSGPALGSGRDARMSGQLSGPGGRPLVGDVHVIAGPNRGRMTSTDTAGRFQFVGLYPGLALVELRRSGETLARRVVNLYSQQKAHLHVAFGQSVDVPGRVIDRNGEPIEGAAIHVDGRPARTDANGRFLVPNVAGGMVPIETQATGFASDHRLVDVLAGPKASHDEIELRLEPEARLLLTVSGEPASGPTKVWILPGTDAGAREQLWPRFEALDFQGQPLKIRGLPAGPIIIHADQVGSRLLAGPRSVQLLPGEQRTLDLPFVPSTPLKGTVAESGAPIEGAIVELFAPDPLVATRTYLGLEPVYEHLRFLPLMSPMAARTTSDSSGSFTLNVPRLSSTWQRLLVTEPVLGRRVERAIKPNESRIQVAFNKPVGDQVALLIVPSDRSADLPYELFVHGNLRQTGTLKPGENLEFGHLVAGSWQINMTQGLREIVPAYTLDLDADTPIEVELIK